jgi:hypothetical protein
MPALPGPTCRKLPSLLNSLQPKLVSSAAQKLFCSTQTTTASLQSKQMLISLNIHA